VGFFLILRPTSFFNSIPAVCHFVQVLALFVFVVLSLSDPERIGPPAGDVQGLTSGPLFPFPSVWTWQFFAIGDLYKELVFDFIFTVTTRGQSAVLFRI